MFHFLPAISCQQAYFFLSFDMNVLLPCAMEIGTLLQWWQNHRRKQLTAAPSSY